MKYRIPIQLQRLILNHNLQREILKPRENQPWFRPFIHFIEELIY